MRQLELNLTPRAENLTSIEPWKYRFTKNALIEDSENHRIIYGLWEKLFGCWVINVNTCKSREIIPTWRPLSENGVWRDQGKIRFSREGSLHNAYSQKWRYEANAAFAGLFSGIPQRIRSVVAVLGHYQWLALDLIWQQPDFARFLDEELFNDSQQFIYACFSLAEAEKLSRKQRSDFAVSLMGRKRTELLSELSGVECTKSTLRAINKLGDTPHRSQVYQAVIHCMTEERTAKALSHTDEIDPVAIDALTGLPDAFLLPNVARILLTEPEAAEDLIDLMYGGVGSSIDTLVGTFPSAPHRLQASAIHSLSRVRSFEQFFEWSAKWENRINETLRFPEPPFPEHRLLTPLTTAAAVKSEALSMRNCVRSLTPGIMEGDLYLFHWEGQEPATVGLLVGQEEGRNYVKALGFNNAPLSSHTESRIISLVHESLMKENAKSTTVNIP
jgi:hypothetical protein